MPHNYRLIKHNQDEEDSYVTISTVYYDEEMNIVSWAETPIALVADDVQEMVECIELYKAAFLKPVLVETLRPDGTSTLIEAQEQSLLNS
ncbi:hypothetical protein [Vibrio sp. D431a]|uniref:hypothetical protein n=1 Tax=Vibrio sp. D431a TaxID=2837388 RepID=UPI0025555C23|nr:hypothetical protein [Vibrio sp. D431a]MDK9789785.1 hypothetical protein [Vibrio sp. D431a]